MVVTIELKPFNITYMKKMALFGVRWKVYLLFDRKYNLYTCIYELRLQCLLKLGFAYMRICVYYSSEKLISLCLFNDCGSFSKFTH